VKAVLAQVQRPVAASETLNAATDSVELQLRPN